MHKNEKNFGYYAGQVIACVLAASLAVCLCGIIIAITLKFLGWIF